MGTRATNLEIHMLLIRQKASELSYWNNQTGRFRTHMIASKTALQSWILKQFVEFSNMHNDDRISNATQANLSYKDV